MILIFWELVFEAKLASKQPQSPNLTSDLKSMDPSSVCCSLHGEGIIHRNRFLMSKLAEIIDFLSLIETSLLYTCVKRDHDLHATGFLAPSGANLALEIKYDLRFEFSDPKYQIFLGILLLRTLLGSEATTALVV